MHRSQFSDRDQQRLRRELSLVENLTRMRRGANKKSLQNRTRHVYYARRGKSEFFLDLFAFDRGRHPLLRGGERLLQAGQPLRAGGGGLR